MRILIATAYRNRVGGTESYLHAVIPCLVKRGHQVGLVYENRFDSASEAIDAPESAVSACCLAEAGLERTRRFIAGWKPDVVYSHGLQAADFQSALLAEYPTVLYAHNYFGTCATGQKCHSFPSPRPCDRRFGPACLLLHYPRRCGGLHPGTMWAMFKTSAEMNRHLGAYAAVLVASTHMYREFEKHGVNPDRIHLAPLPNPHGAAEPVAPEPGVSHGRILFLGRLTKLKGADYLIRAIPLASGKLGQPLALTIAGDGPEHARLQDLARSTGAGVEFAGWVEDRAKADLLRNTDLLAMPSLWPEPFGLAGIEAGAYGVPAVAYEVGGIPDWLLSGQSGELAPGDPPTVEGLADAMVRALADPAHYAKLCRGALEVARRFTMDAHLSRLESIFAAVNSNRGTIVSAPGRSHGSMIPA